MKFFAPKKYLGIRKPIERKQMTVKARFKCVAKVANGPSDHIVSFQADTGPGSEDFTKYTPWGDLRMGLSNDSKALEELVIGQVYSLAFEPV